MSPELEALSLREAIRRSAVSPGEDDSPRIIFVRNAGDEAPIKDQLYMMEFKELLLVKLATIEAEGAHFARRLTLHGEAFEHAHATQADLRRRLDAIRELTDPEGDPS